MVTEIDDEKESERLNAAVKGKVVREITYNDVGDSCIAIYFSDGSRVVLSTLGGVEIEEI